MKTSNKIWTMLDPLDNLQEKLTIVKISKNKEKKLDCQKKTPKNWIKCLASERNLDCFETWNVSFEKRNF
jgi:hypothetical protein